VGRLAPRELKLDPNPDPKEPADALEPKNDPEPELEPKKDPELEPEPKKEPDAAPDPEPNPDPEAGAAGLAVPNDGRMDPIACVYF
jgi:procyclin